MAGHDENHKCTNFNIEVLRKLKFTHNQNTLPTVNMLKSYLFSR